jgi:hypothetical protein
MSKFKLSALLFLLIMMSSRAALCAVTMYGYCAVYSRSMVTKIYQFSAADRYKAIDLTYMTFGTQFTDYLSSHYGLGPGNAGGIGCEEFDDEASAVKELSRQTAGDKVQLIPWIPPGTSLTDGGPSSSTPTARRGQEGGITEQQYKDAQRQADQNAANCRAGQDCHAGKATNNPQHPVDPAKLPAGCKYASANWSEVDCQ